MFRNKEIQRFAVIFLIITVISVIFGFKINTISGILIVVFSFTLGIAFFIFTKARYKKIAQISEQIDIVLHNADHLYISEENEGELSILESEITKMMLRIREQNDALKKEKEHLTDSLADIAHQLRTPLTAANLVLSLIKNSTDERKRKALIRETEELFAQMDWLITSLLKLSRLDAGIVVFQSKPIDVETLINAALHPFQISMELHNISFKKNIPKDVIIECDLGWLSEAIQNIIKNCIESAGDNGNIEILCENTVLFIEIIIHDSGKGFKKEELASLFDRFYCGKNTSTAGYGIGLALSKSIITRQGGTITAKNHPKGGAVFYIRFPK